eukprot:m.130802 g.130802  ORF g.130802 m.130802 type:complete len:413 (-) comp13730_c0_seq1:2403-3641(-)
MAAAAAPGGGKKKKRPGGLVMKPLQDMIETLPEEERPEWREFEFQKQNMMSHFKGSDFVEVEHLHDGFGDARSIALVRHTTSSQVLLKKMIHRDKDAGVVDQIHSEIEILHTCNNINVVKFFGAFISDDGEEVHIVMEYMNGGCLDTLRRRIGRIDELQLGAIMCKSLMGMRYLNKSHVVHRDIKPSNILINTRGQVKLCDFGTSKILHEKSFTATMELKFKTFVGTLVYMSPERLNGELYSPACDIWSLGISVMELAMGYHPFIKKQPYPAPIEKRNPRAPGWQIEPRSAALAVPFDVLQSSNKFNKVELPQKYGFSADINDFCVKCVQLKPEHRARLPVLLAHKWIIDCDRECPQAMLAEYVRLSLPEDPENEDHVFTGGDEEEEDLTEEAFELTEQRGKIVSVSSSDAP